MEWYHFLIIAFLILLITLTIYTGYKIARSIFHPIRHSLLDTMARELEKTPDLFKAYEQWEKIPFTIETRNGYALKAYYLPAEHDESIEPKRFVVIAHGYTYTHHGGIKYAHIMKQLGFNVILYDERYHGESGGKNCSLGYYEEQDLHDVITDTFLRFGSDIFLGTYGESMGATTAILEQAHDDRIRFVIADCGFANFRMLVKYLVKKRGHLPNWPFVGLANGFFKLATSISFDDVVPLNAVQKAKVPIFFIHGTADEFIPPIHTQLLYDACPSPKELYLAPNGARHAESYKQNREEYTQRVLDFMTQYVLK